MPADFRRPRLSSEPRRRKLSSAAISVSGQSCFRKIAMLLPTKPAAPVIQMRLNMSGAGPLLSGRGPGAVVIAAREMLLQPEIQNDEEIPAAHLLKLQLGNSGAAIGPGDWYDCERISADDRLQRHLHGEIEVWRDQRRQALNHLAAVTFERVG